MSSYLVHRNLMSSYHVCGSIQHSTTSRTRQSVNNYPGIADVVACRISLDTGDKLLLLGYEQISKKRPLDTTDSSLSPSGLADAMSRS